MFPSEICKSFKSSNFEEHLRTTASGMYVEYYLTYEKNLLFLTEIAVICNSCS